MTGLRRWHRVQSLARGELQHLATIQPSDRRWQMPFCAALASGLPLLIGAWFGHLEFGLVSSMGGLVFLYTPETALSHRLVTLMACAFGMSSAYALGVMSHFLPLALVPVLTFIAILVSMVCRFYAIGVPGSMFFVMAAAIGAYSPVEVPQVPLHVGLLTLGCLLAVLIAFFYSVYVLRLQAPQPVGRLPAATFDFVVFDSIVIGLFVGLSLALAQALQLERPYLGAGQLPRGDPGGVAARGLEPAAAPDRRHERRPRRGLGAACAAARRVGRRGDGDRPDLRDRNAGRSPLCPGRRVHYADDDLPRRGSAARAGFAERDA